MEWTLQRANWNHPSQQQDNNGKAARGESSTSRSYESSGSNGGRHGGQHRGAMVNPGGLDLHETTVPILSYNNGLAGFDEDGTREEYDQHGVRIESQVVIDFWDVFTLSVLDNKYNYFLL